MNLPAIFSDACGTITKRFDLKTPFPWGDHVYATDGHIMVRCPNDGGLTLEDGRKVPDPTRAFACGHVERITVPLPDAVETIPCVWCRRTGSVTGYQCENCGETQEVMHRGKAVEFDCPDCDGKGVIANPEAVMVSDSPRLYLAARFIGMLGRHGIEAVDIPANPTLSRRAQGDGREAVTFSGDGFEGWLMPLDTDCVERDRAKMAKA